MFNHYLIEKSIGEQFSFDYARSMPLKSMPQIEYPTLNWVSERVSSILERVPALDDLITEMQLNGDELSQLEIAIHSRQNEILAEVNGQKITIAQFVQALRYVPYAITSKSAFLAMDYIVRDALLTQKAEEIGLEEKSKSFPIRLRLFEEDYIQNRYRMAVEASAIGRGTQESEKVIIDVVDRLRRSVKIRKYLKRINGFK